MQPNLTAGDTLNYTTSAAAYSAADGWVLKMRLTPRSSSASAIDITATADGSGWLVQVPASTTSSWTAGQYGWAAWVEKGAEVYTLESGQITVLPNPRTAAAGTDTRSQAETALANIQSVLQGRATAAIASYEINGRKLNYYALADLVRLESKYKTEVNRERAAAGLPPLYPSGGIQRILMRAQ